MRKNFLSLLFVHCQVDTREQKNKEEERLREVI